MKSKKLKFASAFLTTSLLVTPISSLISQNSNIANANENLSINHNEQQKINKLDKYVIFDSKKNEYYITKKGLKNLSKEDTSFLKAKINEANNQLKNINIDNSHEWIEYKNKGIKIYSQNLTNDTIGYRYTEGIDKAEVFWWGVRFYLSKTTLQRLGAGISIGGIWLPHAIISKVVATLGIIISNAPGGIVFDRLWISQVPNNIRFQ